MHTAYESISVGITSPIHAFKSAFRLLERQKLDNGNAWPETIAVVLWGTDNIKTYGESLAQVSQFF